MIIPNCPNCGSERIVRTSHTAKNPERDFVVCKKGCREGWSWVDELNKQNKYATTRPSLIKANTPASFEGLSFSNETSDNKTNSVGDNLSKGAGAGITPSNPLGFLDVQEQVVEPKKEFVPSRYQEKIFEFIKQDNGHAVIEAVAGSGKSRTLIESLNIVPSKSKVVFLSFNKHIVDELKDRVPSNIRASTLHAQGLYNAVHALAGGDYNKLRVNTMKLWDLWDRDFDQFGTLEELKPNVIKAVDLLKATLREPDQESMDYIIDRYNIEVDGDVEKFYEYVPRMYRRSLEDKSEVDFGDMVYWSATEEIPCYKYDYIFSDESQDYNAAQRRMVLNSVSSNGRVIATGDSRQSIFGFQGADIDSIPSFIKELGATTLPLSICYRCHKGAIRLAQKLVPQIEWREDAPEGVVGNITQLKNMRAGDMVLCRTNAPLVEPCYGLIRDGVKATIRGRDIGNGLVAMLKRGEKKALSKDMNMVFAYLSDYVRKEVSKLIQQRKEQRAASLQDQLETLYALSADCVTISDIRRKINQVFSDDAASVVFSTAHRAKGLQAKRVFILHPELFPFPKATRAWEIEQETNLLYVAITRPEQELYFVGETPQVLN